MQSSATARLQLFAHDTAGRLGVAWSLTWIMLCVDVVWMRLAGWSISGRGVATILLAVAVFHLPLAFRRYRSDPRIRAAAQAIDHGGEAHASAWAANPRSRFSASLDR